MTRVMAIHNLKTVTSSDKITVKGKVAENAESFAINLGLNDANYLMHFNPRFGQKVIVCNSKTDGVWGDAVQLAKFPFQKGDEAAITFSFSGQQVRVKFPDEVVFMSNLSLNQIEYISVDGDLEDVCIHLE